MHSFVSSVSWTCDGGPFLFFFHFLFFFWDFQEDDCIIEFVKKHGCKRWSLIAKSLSGRIGKQCRERWVL
jgi:hypothetical protein